MYSICFSDKGWTNDGIGFGWVKRFDEETREKANRAVCVVLADGHRSHHTLTLLCYAKDNKIIILGYPPHCTHVLQGLDVVCFAWMKAVWSQEVRMWLEHHINGLAKKDFLQVFGQAFL